MFILLMAEGVLAAASFGVMADYYEDGLSDMIPVALIIALCFTAFAIISVGGLFRWKDGKRFVILPCLGIKAAVAAFCFALLCITLDHPVAAAAVILFCTAGVAATFGSRRLSTNRKAAGKRKDELMQLYSFSADKAKWRWDSAAEEYCRVHGKTLIQLTEEDNTEIYRCAGTPIAYFLLWIVKNELYSEEFLLCHGEEQLIALKEEQADPVEFLCSSMDYTLTSNDLSPGVRSFASCYYSGIVPIGNGTRVRAVAFENDYYAAIRDSNRLFYCVDFSFERYHRFERLISKNYDFHLISDEACECRDDSDVSGTVRWELIDQPLELICSKGVEKAYTDRCVQHLNHLSNVVIDRLCSELWELFGCSSNLPDTTGNRRRILESLSAGDMLILSPHGDEPAYILGFESEYEEEHGIGWAMRGDEVLSLGYRVDVESPWCRQSDNEYRITQAIRKLKPETVDTPDKAMALAAEGMLSQVRLVPDCLGVKSPEDNRLFLPVSAAELKEEYDIVAERLFVQGLADGYECTPAFLPNSIIPSKVSIKSTSACKTIYHQTIVIH